MKFKELRQIGQFPTIHDDAVPGGEFYLENLLIFHIGNFQAVAL